MFINAFFSTNSSPMTRESFEFLQELDDSFGEQPSYTHQQRYQQDAIMNRFVTSQHNPSAAAAPVITGKKHRNCPLATSNGQRVGRTCPSYECWAVVYDLTRRHRDCGYKCVYTVPERGWFLDRRTVGFINEIYGLSAVPPPA